MRHRVLVTVIAAAAVSAVLAACSGGTTTTIESSTPAASAPATATAAAGDVAFAQLMIPHHQQAVAMADLALQNADSAQVTALAKQIKAAQDPEITQMKGWLTMWGAPMTMEGSDASGMPGMDHGGMDMGGVTANGMMTAEDMAALGKAKGAEFDRMWLQMMINHHQGAIQMAEQVKATTTDPQVQQLADTIIAAQTAEIATMQQELSS
jgi:uncharacterized protein (DUF305 family)